MNEENKDELKDEQSLEDLDCFNKDLSEAKGKEDNDNCCCGDHEKEDNCCDGCGDDCDCGDDCKC